MPDTKASQQLQFPRWGPSQALDDKLISAAMASLQLQFPR